MAAAAATAAAGGWEQTKQTELQGEEDHGIKNN